MNNKGVDVVLACTVCGTHGVVICRPHDAFESSRFGLFDEAGINLCENCNYLWETDFFGTLASYLIINHRGVFRGQYVHMSDMYGLLAQFDVMTRAKLN